MKKISLIIMIAVALTFVFAGCAKTDTAEPDMSESTAVEESDMAEETSEEPTMEESEEAPEPVSLTFAGSTSVGPAIEALADMYMEMYSHVDITVEAGGSSVGVTSAGERTVDMGMASRDVKDEEMTNFPDLQATVLCLDGVAVVVNAENTVEDLTADQVMEIFMGEITDWSEVGGEAGEIKLYTRDSASGTREAFEKAFDVEIDETIFSGAFDSNGALATAVEGDAMGIGYMSLGIVPNYNLNALKIGGVVASTDNMVNGTYAYYRNFNLLTNGDPSEAVAAFMAYCASDEAIEYLISKGYVVK